MQIRFEMWLSELDISANVKQFIMQKYITNPKIILYYKKQIYSFPHFGIFRCTRLYRQYSVHLVPNSLSTKPTDGPPPVIAKKETRNRNQKVNL